MFGISAWNSRCSCRCGRSGATGAATHVKPLRERTKPSARPWPAYGPRAGRGRAEFRTNAGSYMFFRAVCVRKACIIACFFCGVFAHSVQFISHSARIGRQHRLESAPSGNEETGDEWSRRPVPKVAEVAASPEGPDDEAVRNWPSARAKRDSRHVQPGRCVIGKNYKAPRDRHRERLTSASPEAKISEEVRIQGGAVQCCCRFGALLNERLEFRHAQAKMHCDMAPPRCHVAHRAPSFLRLDGHHGIHILKPKETLPCLPIVFPA